MKKTRTKLARARLKVRRAKLDAKIAREKKIIKSLAKKLRKRQEILSRRLTRRARLK